MSVALTEVPIAAHSRHQSYTPLRHCTTQGRTATAATCRGQPHASARARTTTVRRGCPTQPTISLYTLTTRILPRIQRLKIIRAAVT